MDSIFDEILIYSSANYRKLVLPKIYGFHNTGNYYMYKEQHIV